jgi:hypothetical protein
MLEKIKKLMLKAYILLVPRILAFLKGYFIATLMIIFTFCIFKMISSILLYALPLVGIRQDESLSDFVLGRMIIFFGGLLSASIACDIIDKLFPRMNKEILFMSEDENVFIYFLGMMILAAALTDDWSKHLSPSAMMFFYLAIPLGIMMRKIFYRIPLMLYAILYLLWPFVIIGFFYLY